MAEQTPEHEIRLGRIVASIWLNDNDTVTRHNVTLSRIYKPKDGGKWKRSNSFGRDDLLTAAKVLDMAHTWIHERITENAPEPANADA